MRDVFNAVDKAMRVVIGRVDAPFVAGVGVGSVADTIGYGVAHARIVVLHVHLHTEGAMAFSKSSLAHLLEIAQVVLN